MTSDLSAIASQSWSEVPPRVNEFRRFLRVFIGRPVNVAGLIIILLLLICAIFPSLLTSYDPNKMDLRSTLLEPSRDHLLGTDALGRDMLSRIIYGARTAVMVGLVALGIAAVSGMILGLAAGYLGGLVYTIIMRCIDALMVFPPMLLALTIAGMLGGGMLMVMIALGIGFMPGYARVMCGQTLTIKENDYILATRGMGARHVRIMFKHLLPNAFPPMIVLMTMMIGMTILAEAGLSFLGIGISEPAIAWGSLVNDGYKYLMIRPVISLAPGLAIILVVYAFNMVGDGLRDAIDPRLRGSI
ncbi:MAG: ABC transporter permease [Dehalococcoidales bacterium]|nr:ABC transporter permease [Dehalococcoidales bacterium]